MFIYIFIYFHQEQIKHSCLVCWMIYGNDLGWLFTHVITTVIIITFTPSLSCTLLCVLCSNIILLSTRFVLICMFHLKVGFWLEHFGNESLMSKTQFDDSNALWSFTPDDAFSLCHEAFSAWTWNYDPVTLKLSHVTFRNILIRELLPEQKPWPTLNRDPGHQLSSFSQRPLLL